MKTSTSKKNGLKREKNPSWRGGRRFATQGYILVNVGKSHHLAQKDGYAYEHRLVAEQKLGRRLLPGEMVHHINGIKSDNSADNLVVCKNDKEHRFYHSSRSGRRRFPFEENEMIACACGCGEMIFKFDKDDRKRERKHNHFGTFGRDLALILAALRSGPHTPTTIGLATGIRYSRLYLRLKRLSELGKIIAKGDGTWKLI